jgi:hypothetical protein
MGYIVYLIVSLFTGELADDTTMLLRLYFPSFEDRFIALFKLEHRQSALSKQNLRALNGSFLPESQNSYAEDQHALFGLGTDMVNNYDTESEAMPPKF